MSNLLGTSVADPIVPFTSDDKYPTHYAEYGKGGFRSVQTYEDLSEIPQQRLEEGMLVYVISEKLAYQWVDGKWVKSKIGGGIEKVNSLEDIPDDYNEEGNIVYSAQDQAYFYFKDGIWINWNDQGIYVGATPPPSTRSLWIDTANGHYYENNELLYSIQKAVDNLQRQVSELMTLRTNGVISGDVGNSVRRSLINAANPYKPTYKVEIEAEKFKEEYFISNGDDEFSIFLTSLLRSDFETFINPEDDEEESQKEAINAENVIGLLNLVVIAESFVQTYPQVANNLTAEPENGQEGVTGSLINFIKSYFNIDLINTYSIFAPNFYTILEHYCPSSLQPVVNYLELLAEDTTAASQMEQNASNFVSNLSTEGSMKNKLEEVTNVSQLLELFTTCHHYILLHPDEGNTVIKLLKTVIDTSKNNQGETYILNKLNNLVIGFRSILEKCEENLVIIVEHLRILNQEAFDNEVNEIEPDKTIEPTVKHISIKMGTKTQLTENIKNFIPGELVFCTDEASLYIYIKGNLVAISGKSGSDINGDNEDFIMNEETINEIKQIIHEELVDPGVESIRFIPIGSDTAQYTARVNEKGNLIVYDNSLDDRNSEPEQPYYYESAQCKVGLVINSFYLGGIENDEHSYQPCSHNFIELANVWVDKNGKGIDINLNGFYLFYRYNTGDQNNPLSDWIRLDLWGKIPAGGTFLIRGAQCSVMDVNTTKIKVKNYDMEWYETSSTGKKSLIKFRQNNVSFYLCWGKIIDGQPNFWIMGDDHVKNPNDPSDDKPDNPVPNHPNHPNTANIGLVNIKGNTCAKGYIDLVGVGSDAPYYENNPYRLKNTSINVNDVIFRRWYILDPVSQSNPKGGIVDRKNNKYLSASFITKEGNIDENTLQEYTPRASFEGKNISVSRTLFAESHPSTLTCTFGCQATDNSASGGNGATRGFCWNSVGYYDEYIKLKKKTESTWEKYSSITDTTTDYLQRNTSLYSDIIDESIHDIPFINFYKRIRWESAYGQAITTHKVLLRGLTAGVYEYYVGREGDETYKSDTREFTVKSDSQVTNFNFIQVTDQQGANWEEYEVWNLSARIIAKDQWKIYGSDDAETPISAPEFDFIINTGDICYNGSRSNEWIDYFNGYAPLRNKEEMLTLGNNDLAPISMRDIGNGGESPWKINVNVIDYFYCVEVDPLNPQVFIGNKFSPLKENNTLENWSTGAVFKIPSLYSFNYGKFHFISLLSEMRTLAGSEEVKETTNEQGEVTGYDNVTSKPLKSGTTVDKIFGVEDTKRVITNASGQRVEVERASKIYDREEEWLIKDLIKWKNGGTLPGNSNYWTEPKHGSHDSEFDPEWKNREAARFNSSIVGNCRDCIMFIHEMPFNIISTTSYKYYAAGVDVPRETAKAYLNRYHNFEYQRLFKLWGIPLVMGGHKHTAAITYPVYDAPPAYDPILGEGGSVSIMKNDPVTGSFFKVATFDPVVQITYPENGTDWETIWGAFWTEKRKKYCDTVYNHTNTSITLNNVNNDGSSITLPSGNSFEVSYTGGDGVAKSKRFRLEIVSAISSPSYVMCQATGFKNKSNSDLAAGEGEIPWERFYVPGDSDGSVVGQCASFFTVYKVDGSSNDQKVTVNMYKIDNMYGGKKNQSSDVLIKNKNKPGYWDLTGIYSSNLTLEENRETIVNQCVLDEFNPGGTIISVRTD